MVTPAVMELPQIVKVVHRELVKVFHPDAGGDAERMKAVNAAYDVLKRQLKIAREREERLNEGLSRALDQVKR